LIKLKNQPFEALQDFSSSHEAIHDVGIFAPAP
jgi:hypothetical protein